MDKCLQLTKGHSRLINEYSALMLIIYAVVSILILFNNKAPIIFDKTGANNDSFKKES